MVCVKFSIFFLCIPTMIKLVWLLSQRIRNRLTSGCILGLWLTTSTVALAEYQPPPDQKPPSGYSQSTGSRGGCEVNTDTSLTTLAPHNHIGRTASRHPTFAWFVPNSKPYPLEFTLYKYIARGNIQPIYKIQLKSAPGIMKLSLPQSNPGLNFGQRYIWQVAILCDLNYPSKDLVASSEIEVVKMLRSQELEIDQVGDRCAKISLLARLGLWYDYLAEAASASDGGLSKIAAMLELAKQEESATQVNNSRSINLRQIAISSQ